MATAHSTPPSAAPVPAPMGARVNRWLESLTRQLERTPVLSAAGKAITKPVAKLVKAGPVKDLLSGTWLGHPAHPLLTDIPIGAWSSAVFLDLTELAGGANGATRHGSDTLVGLGVLAALPTAASGLSDLSDEYDDQMMAAGGAHALSSLAATGLFAASYIARRRGKRGQGIALSLIGTGLLTAAGFLGGHLSYRKGLGVDHTVFEEPIGDWTAALTADELPGGKPQCVSVGGRDIMLYRANDTIYALANRCTHRGGPLHEGEIDGQDVICPWHQSRFHIPDGSVTRGPAVAPQASYETRVREGKIEVRSKA
ncbi:MAG: Rieske 2Fe-2S domain-containing protein [Pseudonocardiaceae bacterium]